MKHYQKRLFSSLAVDLQIANIAWEKILFRGHKARLAVLQPESRRHLKWTFSSDLA